MNGQRNGAISELMALGGGVCARCLHSTQEGPHKVFSVVANAATFQNDVGNADHLVLKRKTHTHTLEIFMELFYT